MSMNLNDAQVVCRRGTIDTSRMMVANQILGMSSAELQALIHRELGQNPAIEMMEYDVCQRCGHILDGPRCPHCRLLQPAWDIASGEHDDPVAGVPPPVTMAEYLLLALQDQLPTDDAPLAEYLVASLDEDGRLACTTVEAVDLFGVDPDRVERAIHCLQDMEPSGIGARDLRECLLIQLSCLERAGRTPPFVREVISDFLPQLAMHRYGEIASALGTTVTSVTRVGEFIWRNLHPFPARGYMAARILGAGPLAGHILPDVIISRREQSDGTLGYDVQVVESQRFEVQLNPSYEAIDTNVNDCASAVSLEERRQIHHAIARGREFIGHISQRQQMLARITRCLVAMQRDGLEAGTHRFHPMTRAKIAAHLVMHESAVRRAISGKYVMLPSGRVVPYSDFFAPRFPAVDPLEIKDAIRDIIEREIEPLTDQQVANALRGYGVYKTGRTVARYREQLGVLPATLRGGNRCTHRISTTLSRADARAQALLRQLLDGSEQLQLNRLGYLEVASRTHQGRFYRIPAHGGYVHVYEHGQAVSWLCVVPVNPLPDADVTLVHKLLIEADEEAYLAKANHFPVIRL